MGIRQPGMEGNRGHLDSESEEQKSEDQSLEHLGEEGARLGNRCEAEVDHATVDLRRLECQGEDTDEHDQRCYVGVDEELDGRVVPPRASVPGDEEVHRDQGDLPHDVEEEVIRGSVHSHKSNLDGQQQREEVIGAVALLVGERHHDDFQHSGQEDHEYAKTVDREEQAHLESGGIDPVRTEVELTEVVTAKHDDGGKTKGNQGEYERDDPGVFLFLPTHEQSQDGSDQRHQNDCG